MQLEQVEKMHMKEVAVGAVGKVAKMASAQVALREEGVRVVDIVKQLEQMV